MGKQHDATGHNHRQRWCRRFDQISKNDIDQNRLFPNFGIFGNPRVMIISTNLNLLKNIYKSEIFNFKKN